MKSRSKNPPVELSVATKDGEFIAGYSEKGLAELCFPKRATGAAAKGVTPQIRQWHRLTTAAVKQILGGSDATSLPPLDLSAGTDFQRSVWNAMRKIRSGQTLSYGEIAKAVGNPKAVRAVGGACGSNPIPVIVPCHRVLAANKKIGGFSSGLYWKRMLLEREGVRLN